MKELNNPHTQRYNILILGPQGSGKGTQAEKISKRLLIPHISPGAMYRQIQENSTFAKKIAHCIDRGELVPDDITNDLILKRVRNAECSHGFILDGYPRNLIQAEFIKKQIPIEYIITIELSDAVGIERIGGRRVCPQGHTYHSVYNPPKKKDICDLDNLPLSIRADEKPEIIKQRLGIYHRQTKPIIEILKTIPRVKTIPVDGAPSIEDVACEIQRKLGV